MSASKDNFGRILEWEGAQPTPQALILTEDRTQWIPLKPDIPKVTTGCLVQYHLNASGVIDSLQTLSSPHRHDGDALRWRKPGSTSRMERLRQRHQMLRSIRNHFDQQGFLEVQTPLLVSTPNPENHFDPITTEAGCLITSPEFHMKRMLVGGFEKIYQISSCFRGGEVGRYHNPEFTMLEWYRAYEPIESLLQDLESFISEMAPSPMPTPWPRMSVSYLFQEHLKIDLESAITPENLWKQSEIAGFSDDLVGCDMAYASIFSRLWDHIEPKLGLEQPVFVMDWPIELASLAQQDPENPRVSKRVELYANGIELANGFCELQDPAEHRRRFTKELQQREQEGKATFPMDEAFLSALDEGLPPCVGMALGVDRLVMWLRGASHIRDVLCFDNGER